MLVEGRGAVGVASGETVGGARGLAWVGERGEELEGASEDEGREGGRKEES